MWPAGTRRVLRPPTPMAYTNRHTKRNNQWGYADGLWWRLRVDFTFSTKVETVGLGRRTRSEREGTGIRVRKRPNVILNLRTRRPV